MKIKISLFFFIAMTGCVGSKSKTQAQGPVAADTTLVQTETITQNNLSTSTLTNTITESLMTTATITTTNTSSSCDVEPTWSVGSWSPETCTAGVTQQTRSVTCNSTCPCPETAPISVQACTPNLHQGIHYDSECSALLGSVTWIGGSRVCAFDKSECPTGWNPLADSNGISFTITKASKAIEQIAPVPSQYNLMTVYEEDAELPSFLKRVSTEFHTHFEPAKAVESRNYCSKMESSGCMQTKTIFAKITKIACY